MLLFNPEFDVVSELLRMLPDYHITLFVGIAVVTVAVAWLRRKNRLSILERYGIPSLCPHFLYGNLREYENQPNVLFDSHLINRLGKICGYYFGAKPVILVGDCKVLECIQKNPATRKEFLDRPRRIPGGINPDKKRSLMLGNLPVLLWKRMRKVLAPAFGSSNLGAMTAKVESKVASFMKLVEEKKEEEIDFYSLFQYLTLDIISSVAMGIDADMQNNPSDELLKAVQAEFSKGVDGRLIKFYLCCPELSPLLSRVRRFIQWVQLKFGWLEPSALWQTGADVVGRRRGHASSSSNSYNDLLSHVMDSKHGLTETAMVANTVLVYEAAYETTSSCLAFLVHILVNRPKCQKKIRREIKKKLKHSQNGLACFNTLQSLKYLEACIYEALRLYPTQTTFIGRAGNSDVSVKSDAGRMYTIPRGVHVQAALYQIHRDKSFWKKPNQFRPERFLEEGKELTKSTHYQAFGHGPRECIGKGFAIMAIKLILGTLLHKYKLVPSERTEKMGTIAICYKTATMTPANGSHARVVLNTLN